jgi:RHS repeat-associated protein
MATFCDMAYTWDANKNKTSESITGVMSGYGFTSAGTTYDNEDLCISSSLPPPASSLLVDIDANGTADVNFQYDAIGRRVARSGTSGSVVYVQMDQQTIADYPVGGAATTPTFRYVYASYIDEPVVRKNAGTGGTLVYFHRNHQYSITAMTTSTGAVAERYAYTAYGQPTILDASGTVLPTSNFSIRTSYTGREWDATLGLHHFRARWMSPSAGRFIVRDPAVFFDGPNIYSFLRSKAVLGADPSGMWTEVRSICQFSYTPCNIELVGETCYCTFEIRKQCITGRRDNDSLPNHNDGWHYWLPFHRYEDSTEYEQELPVDYCGSCREMMLPEPVLPIAFQFLDDSGWVRLPDPPSVS